MEFRLLGAVEASVDGSIMDIGHARQRCVLAALLLDANRPVSADGLVDRVWGERPPPGARSSLSSYLSRLRQALGPTGSPIRRRHGGYVLEVDPLAVDVHRFQQLLAHARADADADRYRQALDLWRGEALAGVDSPWVTAVRADLRQQRLDAEVEHHDLGLRAGRHEAILADLTAAAAAHPFDERVGAQHMVALYRCGRQADALAAFRQMRGRLLDELAVEPGPALSRLHQQILNADPELDPPRPDRPGPAATIRQLPAPPVGFSGRRRELGAVTAALDAAGGMPICVISGGGGMGKTWLASRWAHDNAGRFPDGQLFVDLRGFRPDAEPLPAADALRSLLGALGVPPASIPGDQDGCAALYRGTVAGRRLLIVLDNADDSRQVAPLLPGTDGCAVLVTSRRVLTGLVTSHGARPVPVGAVSTAEARALLGERLGERRMAAEPEPVDALLRHCAGLPLALGIVAARSALRPDRSLAVLAAELREAATRLDALDAGEIDADLRTVLACSQRALPAPARRLFRQLSLAAGPDIGLPAAASLAGLPPARVRTTLRTLTDLHLLDEYVPGRYRMHDLVRLYAWESAAGDDDEPGRRVATGRLAEHYLHTAYAAAALLCGHREPIDLAPLPVGVRPQHLPDLAAALAWFDAERPVLVATVTRNAEVGEYRLAWQLAWTLATYMDRRGHWADWVATQRVSVAATRRLGLRADEARAHRSLGRAHDQLGNPDAAYRHYTEALTIAAELGDLMSQAHTHRGIGRVAERRGDHRSALRHDLRALDLFRAAGHRAGEAIALNAVGWSHAQLGHYPQALDFCLRALALTRAADDRRGTADTLDSVGYIHHHLGRYRDAVASYRQALALYRRIGERPSTADTLDRLGDTYAATGDGERARETWREAAILLDDLDLPAAHRVRVKAKASTAADSMRIQETLNPLS